MIHGPGKSSRRSTFEIHSVRYVYGLPQSSKQMVSPEFRRVCIFGLCVETLSPGPVCIRTPAPLRVNGLYGLKAVQVEPGQISLSGTRCLFASTF